VSQSDAQPYVVDASVATKWFLDDEHDVERARKLLDDIGARRVRLLAPTVFPFEVINALHAATRSKRISEEFARQSISDLHVLPIRLIGGTDLQSSGYEYALRFGCAYYDALYLALADAMSCRLVYADRRLQSRIAGRVNRESWISRYGA